MGTHASERESFVRTGVPHAAARDAIENAIRMLPGDLAQRQEIVASIVDGGCYGLLVETTRMAPVYRPGDTLIVEPLMALAAEDFVVLYRGVGNGAPAERICAELRSFDEAHWHLSQLNPPEDFTLPRAEWPACHRVTGVYHPFEYPEDTANG